MGIENLRKSSLLGEVSLLNEMDEGGSLDEEGKKGKIEASSELNLLIDMEETSWRRKSRATWLKERDRCTMFFHRIANSNRRVNLISCLEWKGCY